MKRLMPILTIPMLLSVCLLIPHGIVHAELFTFPEKPVDTRLSTFKNAIDRLHMNAVRSSKPWTEASLRKGVPRKYLYLEKHYSRIKDRDMRALALAQLALLYSELAWVERIEPIRKSLGQLDKGYLARLGYFEESEHFLVRVVGADPKWGKAALRLAEAARQGYVELFGFNSISGIPGKKVRILIHVDPAVQRPRLFFHPTPRFHSEMRYEMPDEKYLTLSGKRRIVYGFCHEMGHMLAMWGKYRVIEDDKHAWGHYTGCLIVEAVYDRLGNEPWPTWTAFQRQASGIARLKKQIDGHEPGTASYEAILSLFHAIGDELGTDTYGKAWNWLEKKKRFRKINAVRYLWLRDLKGALLNVVPQDDTRRVRELFG